MLDHDRARPQRGRRLLEEAGQHAVLKTLDVDLQGVDLRHAGLIENALQPQRRHLDGIAGGLAGHDMAGAEIVAVGLDQQFAVGRSRGRGHQLTWVEPDAVAVEFQPRMRHRMRLDRDHLAIGADVTRQRQRIGADIGADIDEHAALALWARRKSSSSIL